MFCRGNFNVTKKERYKYKINTDLPFCQLKSLLSAGVRLPDDNISFNAPEFAAQTEKAEFYEAPQDVTDKHAVASFFFTYPLATKDLESKIKVTANSGKTQTGDPNVPKTGGGAAVSLFVLAATAGIAAGAVLLKKKTDSDRD